MGSPSQIRWQALPLHNLDKCHQVCEQIWSDATLAMLELLIKNFNQTQGRA